MQMDLPTFRIRTSPGSVVSFPGVSDHNPVVMAVAGLGEAPAITMPTPQPAVVEAAPEPVQKEASPGFAPEDGLQPVQVREIIVSPPTFTDNMPGVKPKATPVVP